MDGRPVVVAGSGFAALTALRSLRRAAPALPLTLVTPVAEFCYAPSLIWVPTGAAEAGDLILPIAPELRRLRVDCVVGRALGLAGGGHVLRTTAGDIAHSGLLIASGARPLNGPPGCAHTIIPCAGAAPLETLRSRLRASPGGTLAFGFAANPEEPQAMRGGPVFELLFGIDTWLRRQGYRSRFTLAFFAPTPEPGKRLGDAAVRALLAEMARRQIQTHLGHALRGFRADAVLTGCGALPADLIVFQPGLTGPDWAAESGLTRSPGGFFAADALGRVAGRPPGAPPIYVAGDAGSYPGPDWLPKQGHMADRQARAAAANLLAERAGRTPAAVAAPELLCIVDTLDAGILVYRTPRRNLVFRARWLHAVKRGFERIYLWRLRRGCGRR